MSHQKIDSDGFQVVHSKRGIKFRTTPAFPFIDFENPFGDRSIDKKAALRRLKAAKEELECSDYYKSLLITLKESLDVLNCPVVEIFCLALGHIGEWTISQYQLGLVLCLKEHFKVKCFLHDPIFHSDECDILKGLDLNLIEENEEGKHTINSEGVTIAFFPHCHKQLTNNFLWQNWGVGLKNCVLIGNSFTSLIESDSQESLNINAPYILNISPYVQEFSLVNSFKFSDIFNDTSIHIFPESALTHITDNFWVKEKAPEYKGEAEFVTVALVKKLKIK